jgi:hypothetical protein
MVDDSVHVTQQPPAPPKDPGPKEGSDEWIKIQEFKQRRRENGAGIAFATGKSIKTFILEITFKEQADDETSGDLPNLFNIHKNFVAKLFEITNGDCHLTPSAKSGTDSTTESTKSPIVNLSHFPTSDRDHRRFFQRRVETQKNYRKTSVKITHHVLMKESVKDVKSKLWNYLTEKGLWMRNGDLNSVETSAIGWLLGAHPQLVFRPAIEQELNRLVASLPIEVREDAVAIHGTEGEAQKLPSFFIHSREQGFGYGDGRVSTSALTVSCVTDRARLMKELLSNVDDEEMPYMFIPYGMPTMEAQEHYKKAIIKNNDKQNAVQGLAVRGFSQELFQRKMDSEDNNSMTVENYFFSSPAIISIENTFNTEENGRFIFIVLKESFHEVRAFLQDFCSKKFKEIYSTQDERDNYRVMYKSLPHLQLSPNAGGAVAKLTARIIQKLDEEERTTGVKLATTQTDTWASRVTPRFSFDKNSPHPNAKKISNFVAVTPTNTIPVIQSAGANDNGSINSGSTLANGTSGQTVVSQDLSTVVSQLQSQASEQSKMFKEMMEKQDKRDRRAAQVQKKMMNLILTMLQQSLNPAKTTKNKKGTKKIIKKSRGNSRKTSGYREHTADEEDITSMDDDIGSAGDMEYGTNGELGPFFSETDDDEMEEETLGVEDGDEEEDEQGSGSDEDSKSSEDDESNELSDGSSKSDDEDSAKTATTKNRPTSKNKETEVATDQDPKTTNTLDNENTEQSSKSRDEPQNTTEAGAKTGSGTIPVVLRQQKRHVQSNLTKEEALAHTQARIEATQQEKFERDETKRQMGIAIDLEKHFSEDDNMSTPPKSRSRLRSPGSTPDNETKMQRTSRAPGKPTTQNEIARELDYSSTSDKSQEIQTMGTRSRRGKQEK